MFDTPLLAGHAARQAAGLLFAMGLLAPAGHTAHASDAQQIKGLESVKFLGADCTAATETHDKTVGSLNLAFKAFKLNYDPAKLGAHTAHCKILLELDPAGPRITGFDVKLSGATGAAFTASLHAAVYDSVNVVNSTPTEVASGDLPRTVSVSFPENEYAPQDCDTQRNAGKGSITEITVALIAKENGENALGTMAIEGISGIKTAGGCHADAEASPAPAEQTADAEPSIAVTGFGDGPTGPCTFLFDGGKLQSVSRNMADDRIYFQIFTNGTKRGLLEYWDTMESERMACNINISVSKSSAFQMKFVGATIPVVKPDARNAPFAFTLTAAQQRSQGDARKFAFKSADVAPQLVNVTKLELEEEGEVTKCANSHNFRLTFSFKASEAREYIQHLQLINGPTLVAKHQECQ